MFDSSPDASVESCASTDSMRQQLKVHKELQHINDLTTAVMKENTQLRAQVQSATSMASKIDDINKKNVCLMATIRQLTNAKNDLNQRLEISLKARDEVEKKMSEEKKNNIATVKQERNRAENELKKADEKHQAQLNLLYSELEKAQESSNKTDLANRLLENQIERLVNAATHYFRQSFNSVDDLISCFENNSIRQFHQEEHIPCPKAQYPQMEEKPNELIDKKKLKKLRMKNRSLQECIFELKRKLSKRENENKRVIENHKRANSELKNKLEELNNEYESKTNESTQIIQKLNNKVDTLENEIKQRKEQIQKLSNEIDARKYNEICMNENSKQDAERHAKENELNQIQMCNAHLDNANSELVRENEDLRNSLKSLNEQVEKMQKIKEKDEKDKEMMSNEKQKCISELESIKVLQSETAKEVDTLRKALFEKQSDQNLLDQKKRCIRQLKVDVNSLQKTISNLQNENENLKTEREKFMRANEQLGLKAEEVKKALAKSNIENQSLKEDIDDLKTELKRNTKTVDDFISLNSFNCSEFPQDLANKISEIVSNTVLSINSKISQSFSEITSYYNQKLESLRNELNDQMIDKQDISNELKNLILNLAIALGVQNKLETENTTYLVEETKKIRDQLANCQRVNKEQEEMIQQIKSSVGPCYNGCDFNQPNCNLNPNVIYRIEEINTKLTQALSNCECQKKKTQKYKRILNSERKVFQIEKIRLEKELLEKNQEITTLQSECKIFSKQKEEISKKYNQVKEQNIQLKYESEIMKKKYDDEIEAIQNKYASEKVQYEVQIRNMIDEKHKNNETHFIANKDQESVIAALNNTIETQKKMIDVKNEEMKKLVKETDKKVNKIKVACDTEKQQLIESYTNTIRELQSQCEKHRSDLTLLSSEVSRANSKTEKLRKKNRKLLFELTEKKHEIDKLIESKSRDDQLYECSSKATMAAIENRFMNQINEMEKRQEAEKKRIFNIAAEEMNDFANGSESLNEKQFRKMIKQAGDEIRRLKENEATIKNMLSSTNCDTTVEAVAHILFKK